MTKKSILVIKHGALGDLIQALDAFASLRQGHPKDRLVLLTAPPFAELARMMPWFDEVVIDPRAGLWHFAEHWRLAKILKAGWSRIYDFQCSRRTARYFRFIIRRTGTEFVGTAPGASHPLPSMDGVNNRDRMLRIAALGGCPTAQASLDWLKSAAQQKWPERLAVLVPGCSPAKPSKRWPPEQYGELAVMLVAAGYRPAVVGTQADRAAADTVISAAPQTLNLIGRTSLPELAGVFAAASLVVGNDTGPVFLAARCAAPTLMLMGPDTDPTMSAPVGPKARWLKVGDLNRLQPQEVLEQCQGIMSTNGGD